MRLERWVRIHRMTKRDDIPGTGIEVPGDVGGAGAGRRELRPLMGAPDLI